MKHVRKIFAFAVALVMALAVAVPAKADDGAAAITGTITINNAAKGETYSIYKLFDATYDANHPDRVNYRGDIPAGLADYFTADDAGNVTATDALINTSAQGEAKLTAEARAALKSWAAGQTATDSAVGNGSTVEFTGLSFGYYIVTTTQDAGNFISINTTNPSATINDKNTTTPVNNPTKTIDDNDVYVGQTVTYTVKFGTASYNGTKKIMKYIITDDFANGALDRNSIHVTSIIVDNDGDNNTENDRANVTAQFNNNGTIEIPWVNDDDAKSLKYDNGATITITYTGTVARAANIAGDGNTNTVGITFTDDSNTTPEPSEASTTFKTYAFVVQKTNPDRELLSGATFQLPFFVYETADSVDGAYIYAGTEAGEGKINTLTTDANGRFIVKGLESGADVSLTETQAPAGYNKLDGDVTVTPVKTSETTTTYYFNAQGQLVDQASETTTTVSIDKIAATPIVVLNQSGTTMPSTGGIGTTIFYIVGGVMVAGAVVFLLTKRRAAAAE